MFFSFGFHHHLSNKETKKVTAFLSFERVHFQGRESKFSCLET